LGKKEIFSLTGMAEILEGKMKISQFKSPKTDADTLRYWICMWAMAERNSCGLISNMPSAQELRWLVTDDGFYITKQHPVRTLGASIEKMQETLKDLESHLAIVIKLGAPERVIEELNVIVNELTISMNKSQGNYDHISLEELERQLKNREFFASSECEGIGITVAGPTASQLSELIAKRRAKDG
jgi:uncharacterized coiled-coil protein SlyX